jgi:polyribonucleotide nucleotidyltransferase
LPFDGPVGAVQVGYKDGKYLINPTREELENSLLNLLLAGKK